MRRCSHVAAFGFAYDVVPFAWSDHGSYGACLVGRGCQFSMVEGGPFLRWEQHDVLDDLSVGDPVEDMHWLDVG